VEVVLMASAEVRPRTEKNVSQAFSDWHRTLPSWYAVGDIDYIYFDKFEPYLIVEQITIKNGDLTAPHNTHALREWKEPVYTAVAEALGVPAYAVWSTETCDEFVVQRIDEDTEEVGRLRGESEYCDFLDRFRLGGEK
jgi:hypothetical protein